MTEPTDVLNMSPEIKTKNNVVIEGDPDARQTIVFAHGFGTDQTAWNWVKEAFAPDYRLVLYDNVGAGAADPDAFHELKYSHLDAYAEDLLAILKNLDLADVVIIAHSVSSMIAMLAAIKAPQYFSKMVFIGASPCYINDEGENYCGGFTQDALNGMYNAMYSNYTAWANGFSVMAMANQHKPELAEQFAYTLSAIRPDIALSVAKVIFEADMRRHLVNLHKEVLLLQSADDIAVPGSVAEYLHRHIKGSKLIFLKATGHFPHISSHQEVIAAIKGFI